MPLAKAKIINVEDKNFTPIKVMYNPSSLTIKRINRYSDFKNLTVGVLEKQYVMPENDTLTVQLYFDTTDMYADIKNFGKPVKKLIEPIFNLTKVPNGKKKPPLIKFAWGDLIFQGYISSITQTSDYFNTLGWAQRANLDLIIISSEDNPNVQTGDAKPSSTASSSGATGDAKGDSAATKEVTAKPGDTVSSIARDAIGDPKNWREFADKNNIDPNEFNQGLMVGKTFRV